MGQIAHQYRSFFGIWTKRRGISSDEVWDQGGGGSEWRITTACTIRQRRCSVAGGRKKTAVYRMRRERVAQNFPAREQEQRNHTFVDEMTFASNSSMRIDAK